MRKNGNDGWIDEDNTMLGHLYKRQLLKLDGEQKETYCLGCFLADLAGGGLNLDS